MFPNNTYENLRRIYKPENVEVLFIGESRPQAGKFFYQENSAFYREPKKPLICISLNLYSCIRTNIPRLVDLVQQEKPKLIIVCKKTLVEPEIRRSEIMDTYRDEKIYFFFRFQEAVTKRSIVKA